MIHVAVGSLFHLTLLVDLMVAVEGGRPEFYERKEQVAAALADCFRIRLIDAHRALNESLVAYFGHVPTSPPPYAIIGTLPDATAEFLEKTTKLVPPEMRKEWFNYLRRMAGKCRVSPIATHQFLTMNSEAGA